MTQMVINIYIIYTYLGLSFFKVSSLCRTGMFDLGEAYPKAYPEAYPLEMLLL